MGVHLGDKAIGVGFVTEKEVPKIKFGAGIDNIIGNIDANGMLSKSTEEFDFVFDGVKTFGSGALYNKFRSLINLRNVYMPDCTAWSGNQVVREAFSDSSIKGL